jgi:hypothetical protein
MRHIPYRLAHPLIEPAPCESRARAVRCKTELLACAAFAAYFVGKSPRPDAIAIAPRTDASRQRYVKLLGA